MPAPAPAAARPRGNRKMFWLVQFRVWHWTSGAVCLVGILLFALTGITLNHAADIEAKPVTTSRTATLPDALRARLAAAGGQGGAVPGDAAAWIDGAIGIDVAGRAAEWSADEVYVALPRPGGDAFLSVGLADGAVLYERTDRGWIAYLNDLHKGRHAGVVWSWFLDLFSLACAVFALSGLGLLALYARGRASTWPLVGAGFVLPALIAIAFIH